MLRAGPNLSAILAETPAQVHVTCIDLRDHHSPRACRSVLTHRMVDLQARLLRSTISCAVVVVLLSERTPMRGLLPAMCTAAESVVHRVELGRGSTFGLTLVVDTGRYTAAGAAALVKDGPAAVPEGAAVISWEQAVAWGIRAAVAAERI